MTTAELKEIIKNYAQEDVNFAKEGEIIISDTKSGVITIHCIGEIFQAYNYQNELLTGAMNEEKMIDWLCNQYIIES